jgi:hypothetical protein
VEDRVEDIEEKQRWLEAAAKRFVHTQKERKKKK